MKAEIYQQHISGWWHTIVALHEPTGMKALTVRAREKADSLEGMKACVRKRMRKMNYTEGVEYINMTPQTKFAIKSWADGQMQRN